MKPPTPEMLRRRAARGTLEVEHLLAAARTPSQALADALRALAAEHGWRRAPCLPHVPFASWSHVVVLYCEGGLPALAAALGDEAQRDFALALLVELGDEAALAVVLDAADALAERQFDAQAFASELAGAINSLGMRGLGQAEAAATRARRFLDGFLRSASSHAHIGAALCGLRYFGDEGSLALVRGAPALPPEWETARMAAVRGIRKRLRAMAA